MTESEAIKICNTIVFATSFSNPQGVPLNTTKEELTEAIRMSIQALEKQEKIKEVIANANQWCKEDVIVKAQAFCEIEAIMKESESE